MMPRQHKRRVEEVMPSSIKRRCLNKSTDRYTLRPLSTNVTPVNQPMKLALANNPEVEDMMEENVRYTNGRLVREAKLRVTYKIVGKSIVHTVVKEEKCVCITTSSDSRKHTMIPVCAPDEVLVDNEEIGRNVDPDVDSCRKTDSHSVDCCDLGPSCNDSGYSDSNQDVSTEVSGVEDNDNGAESDSSVDGDNSDYSYTEMDIDAYVDGGEDVPPWHGHCATDSVGDCYVHKSGCDCCRYRRFFSNENYRHCQPEMCPKEIYDLREAWENKTLGECQDLVREVDIGPGRSPYIYLYTDEMIKMSRAHALCFEQLRVDRTWNLGACYVTTLVFRNHNLLQRNKDIQPLMTGPVLLHFNQEYSTYKKFFRHVCNAMGFSDGETKFLGPDMKQPKKDRVIHQAMKEVFGENVALTDSSHIPQSFRIALMDKIRCYTPLLDVIEKVHLQVNHEIEELRSTLANIRSRS